MLTLSELLVEICVGLGIQGILGITNKEYCHDIDNLPKCPNCGSSLLIDSAGDRDTETMGGYSVEYYKCPDCQEQFEVIDDSIYPTD